MVPYAPLNPRVFYFAEVLGDVSFFWLRGHGRSSVGELFCPLSHSLILMRLPYPDLDHASLFLYNNLVIELNIPGRGTLQLEHLVCDVNGTLAVDGQLIEGLSRSIHNLRDRLTVHLITADTHRRQSLIDQQLGLQAVRLQPGDEARQKAEFVRKLGAEGVIALGQGANDADMLKEAALGVCVLSKEGTAVEALLAADLLAPDIFFALELLEKPLRIVAGLRR